MRGFSLQFAAYAFAFGLPLAHAAAGFADYAVTDVTVSIRGKVESRDDREFQQFIWGDRDILVETRIRGAAAITEGRWRADLELQDQRIPTSQPPLYLDASPMPTPASTTADAGFRLAGRVRYRFGGGSEAALGAYPVEAAGGLLIGADEYRTGYRPLGLGWRSTGFGHESETQGPSTLVWAGMHRWNEIVGGTLIALVSHARPVGAGGVEVGVLGRRIPSRPLYTGVQELSGTPYVSFVAPFRRLRLSGTAAFQAGNRHYLPRSGGLTPEAVFADGHYPRRFSAFYTGSSGSRRVRAGFVRTALDMRLPISWEPTLTLGGSVGTGGGGPKVDHNYVAFVHDTNEYFGNAGYFGERNARAVFGALMVPLRNGWSARAAVWRVEVPSPAEGPYLENGLRLAPSRFNPAGRSPTSHDALKEWDAELRWRPVHQPLGLRLAYSEVRHGHYLQQILASLPRRVPASQWAAVQLEWTFDSLISRTAN